MACFIIFLFHFFLLFLVPSKFIYSEHQSFFLSNLACIFAYSALLHEHFYRLYSVNILNIWSTYFIKTSVAYWWLECHICFRSLSYFYNIFLSGILHFLRFVGYYLQCNRCNLRCVCTYKLILRSWIPYIEFPLH